MAAHATKQQDAVFVQSRTQCTALSGVASFLMLPARVCLDTSGQGIRICHGCPWYYCVTLDMGMQSSYT